MGKFPVFASDLVKWLDQMYPNRVPRMDAADREIWAYVGQRELVEGLLRWLKESEENEEG